MRSAIVVLVFALALAGCPITTVCRPGLATDDAGDCVCPAGTSLADGGACVAGDGGP